MTTRGEAADGVEEACHVVLKVRDLDRSEAFYTGVLEPLPFDAARR